MNDVVKKELSQWKKAVVTPAESRTDISVAAKYTGLVLGPVASALVFPYARRFGVDFAKKALRFNNQRVINGVGNYFGGSGFVAVSSLAALACSTVFPDVVTAGDPRRLAIQARATLEAAPHSAFLAGSTLAGCISAIPTSYLTYQQFRPTIGRGALPLALVTQTVWSTVLAWSLYELPTEGLVTVKKRLASHQPDSTLAKRMAIVSQLETQHQKSEETRATAYDEAIVRQLGLMIGCLSAGFFYPFGVMAGKSLAASLGPRALQILPPVVGATSFFCNGSLSAYATQDCADKSYLAAKRALDKSNPESITPSLLMLMLLSLSSSAHRMKITSEFVNVKTPSGAAILFCAVTSLICTNYWSMNGLSQQLSKKEEVNATDEEKEHATYERTRRDVAFSMSDEHITELYKEMRFGGR